MTSILLLILTVTPVPANNCEQIDVELQRGVAIGYLTPRERLKIYNRCVAKFNWTHLPSYAEGLKVGVLFHHRMIHFDSQTIILAVIGMVGLFSTAVVLITAFKRNRTGTGRYQWVLLLTVSITLVRLLNLAWSLRLYGTVGRLVLLLNVNYCLYLNDLYRTIKSCPTRYYPWGGA